MESVHYGVVGNIPADFHTIDLRHFFSDGVERNQFQLFHFLHRKEVQIPKEGTVHSDSKTFCCIVKFWTKEDLANVIKRYHSKHWINHKKALYSSRCRITPIKSPFSTNETNSKPKIGDREWKYLTNREKKELNRTLNTPHRDMEELKPPLGLPQGNVGTPFAILRQQVQQCILPPAVLKRLGINDSVKVFRLYGRVHYKYDYDNSFIVEEELPTAPSLEEERDLEDFGEDIEARYTTPAELSDSDQDAEEWERHEALEREEEPLQLFEEPIELQWEKGGSGLVFYTDDVYWDSLKGDFDERESDHWDVEIDHYWERESSPDRDQRDSFSKERAGNFERFSNGVAGRLMRQLGWREGKGIGARSDGIAHPLVLPSQLGKQGLGFHGVKPKPKKKRKENLVEIGSIFDPVPPKPPKDPYANFRIPPPKRTKIAFVSPQTS